MPDALLRLALEAAWVLARATERAEPGTVPRPLRPVLGHARVTGAALQTVRRVLDEDDGFRALVAAGTTEDDVGRAGWLFLHRPPGWEDELAVLAAAAADTSDAERAARDERSATRRLRGAEDARQRAESALEDARAQASRAAAELADERRSRRAAESAVRASAERIAALERERDDAVARADEVPALRARIAELEAALDQARATPPPPAAVPEALVDTVTEAATAARALSDALAAAAASLEDELARPSPTPEAAPKAGARPVERARRRPAPLPPGIHDDSVEGAEHLVRRRGALLLVDGYNASLRYRADLPIPELRRRFVDALDELAARTGVDVHVVFDGASPADGGGGTVVTASARRGRARVTFSAPDTEADDVILGLVDAVPLDRVVLVASDDRRVRAGAEDRGANLLSTRQLLAVLRREPDA